MKVYVVTSGQYSDYSVDAVFTDKLEAEVYVTECLTISKDVNDIAEWETGRPSGEDVIVPLWRACICLGTGLIDFDPEPKPYWRGCRMQQNENLKFVKDFREESFAILYSSESLDHAKKLAVEFRQFWLRTRGGVL